MFDKQNQGCGADFLRINPVRIIFIYTATDFSEQKSY
jgi:hypothetical protein